MKDVSTYEIIIGLSSDFPLIAYSAQTLKEHINNADIIIGTLMKHQQNLDWNLNRIYRIRNEIVHNAGNNLPIETVVSHLRYYLVFILNSIIDYFLNSPIDIDQNSKLTLDDLFILREVQVDNLTQNNLLTIDEIISINNPTEYLS